MCLVCSNNYLILLTSVVQDTLILVIEIQVLASIVARKVILPLTALWRGRRNHVLSVGCLATMLSVVRRWAFYSLISPLLHLMCAWHRSRAGVLKWWKIWGVGCVFYSLWFLEMWAFIGIFCHEGIFCNFQLWGHLENFWMCKGICRCDGILKMWEHF